MKLEKSLEFGHLGVVIILQSNPVNWVKTMYILQIDEWDGKDTAGSVAPSTFVGDVRFEQMELMEELTNQNPLIQWARYSANYNIKQQNFSLVLLLLLFY